jgi:hypothetical protein
LKDDVHGNKNLIGNIVIAVLTSAMGSASKRSLVVMFTVSGPAPGSGAKRRNQELDEVSTAILGDGVTENK